MSYLIFQSLCRKSDEGRLFGADNRIICMVCGGGLNKGDSVIIIIIIIGGDDGGVVVVT